MKLRSPLASIKGFAETMRRDPAMPTETRQEFMTIILRGSHPACSNSSKSCWTCGGWRRVTRRCARPPFDFKAVAEETVRGGAFGDDGKEHHASERVDGRRERHRAGRGGRNQPCPAQLAGQLRSSIRPEGSAIRMRGHCRFAKAVDRDHGPGPSASTIRIYRTSSTSSIAGARRGRQKGTGLGLAIVKHIVERHGGHLGVRSEVGSRAPRSASRCRARPGIPIEPAKPGDDGRACRGPGRLGSIELQNNRALWAPRYCIKARLAR